MSKTPPTERAPSDATVTVEDGKRIDRITLPVKGLVALGFAVIFTRGANNAQDIERFLIFVLLALIVSLAGYLVLDRQWNRIHGDH